jgi:colicin import membrane protein
MWQAVRENPRAVIYAVLMHLVLLLLLVFSLDWTPKAIKPGTNKPIQAQLVDMSKLKAIEEKKQAEQQRIKEEKRKLEQQKLRKAEAERNKKVEQERKAEAERNKKVEQERKVEAERKKKAEQEKKRKVEAERNKKAEQEKKRKAEAEREKKAEQEKKRKSEAERKKKAEQEKKRKAEAERKKKAEAEAARRKEAEQALQAQLAEEQAQHALSQYIPHIQAKIQRNWLRPPGSSAGLSCLILVKLIPGGEVVDAKVVRSSGDPLFDRSVETAVLKASPLPLPQDAAMFKHFREIQFIFIPDE